MKKSVLFSCFLALASASTAFSSGLNVNFVHPDKVFKIVKNENFTKSEMHVDLPTDCSQGCSETCVTLARRIVSDCGGASSGPNSPGFGACVDQMKTYFQVRSGTSSDQDAADAVSYCVSGADPTCPNDLVSNYFRTRTGTSTDQDRADAARACQNGVTLNCMQVVYPQYHARSGTSATQDVDDSSAACQRHSKI